MSDSPSSADSSNLLSECEQILGYEFQDPELLKRCLTHASAARTRLESNERLEFLGDAILGAVVCEMLYQQFPTFPEGELTRIKSTIVSRNTCAQVCRRLQLQQFLIVGKGLATNNVVPMSVLAAVIEALIAGVYLDGGVAKAGAFIERLFQVEIERVTSKNHRRNFKSMLQQISQRRYGETPVYKVLDEKGPDHSKCFEVAALIGQQTYPSAWGPNKKEAEQLAASNALEQLNSEEFEDDDD